MAALQFKKAIKEQAKLLMAISGPSGSGKTYTALTFASELAGDGRIAVLDTEHGSASKYADLFDFDVLEMRPPFHPDRFTEIVKAAKSAGYSVLVMDSLTHAWDGEGGALDIVNTITPKFKGNSYMAWGEVTPIWNKMLNTIVGSGGADGMHVIGTMRSKTEYILQENSRGKTVPKKVGMASIIRANSEYEFDILIEMDIDNVGVIMKTRCPALTGGVYTKPGKNVTDILKEWLGSGAAPTVRAEPEPVFEKPVEQVERPAVSRGQAFSQMNAAQSVEAWSESAYDLPEVRQFFDDVAGVAKFRNYVANGDGFKATHNQVFWKVLEEYINGLGHGATKRDALSSAQSTWKMLGVNNGAGQPAPEPVALPQVATPAQELAGAVAEGATKAMTFGKDPADILQATNTEVDGDLFEGEIEEEVPY